MKKEIDPFAITHTFDAVNGAWQQNREAFAQYCRNLTDSMRSVNERVFAHLQTTAPEKPPTDGAQVFMTWVNNLSWSSKQYHHVICNGLTRYVDEAPDVPTEIRQKAHFWVRQIQAMLEPSNCFWTNPKAVDRFVKSKGESLNKGLCNWMKDIQSHKGLVALADQKSFLVGKNLATTHGKVIFRNELMELIQYAPQTKAVWQTPIVLIQPWINKFYIFDLSPRNSFVSYLVGQGYSVFITSWKNPGPDMRHVTFEDYMRLGALAAVNVAREICNSRRVHLAGYCIGGTLIAALMGWLAHKTNASPVADVTLFSTLLDFSEPGDLGAMIQPGAIETLEQIVAENGLLEDHQIAAAFRLLNPGDLIWRYVVNNYFYGEPPPRSDMLFWNSDSTNLPEAMCTFYLKSFYLENRMARSNALTIGQRTIDLKKVRAPFYVVGAAKDHICPWRSTFQTCRLVGGKVRYVLSDEGHITGIVTPPSRWSKKKYWAGAATRLRNADKWLHGRQKKEGSWWPDWILWLRPRSGKQAPPPGMGSGAHPPICSAPGAYVHE